MMHPLCDEFKTGTCEWCGDEGAVFADNSLCEDCDSNIIHCSICKEDQHEDSTCRHVFRDENFEWTGSGGFSPSDDVKKSFIRLLAAMPEGFTADLRGAIADDKFHTWLIAPCIGPGGVLMLHGTSGGSEWGDHLLTLGQSDQAELYSDGYEWLVSLYDGDTPKANQITLGWIDEFTNSAADVVQLHKTDGGL